MFKLSRDSRKNLIKNLRQPPFVENPKITKVSSSRTISRSTKPEKRIRNSKNIHEEKNNINPTNKNVFNTPFNGATDTSKQIESHSNPKVFSDIHPAKELPLSESLEKKSNTSHLFSRIDDFTGFYNWLALTYATTVYFNGECYPSASHALLCVQFKGIDQEKLNQFKTEKDLREFTKNYMESENWTKQRLKFMEQIQRDKFRRNPELLEKLKETGTRQLVWNNKYDAYFGIVDGSGQNHLGRILQEIRSDILAGNDLIAWLLLCHDINTDPNTQPLIRLFESKEGLKQTKNIELKGKPFYKIGKLPDNDIIPLNPSVSRNHALITTSKEGKVLIFDLKSKSKTFINGSPLAIDHYGFILKSTDMIKLGTSSRKYRVEIDNTHVMEQLEKRVKDLNREIKKLSGDVDTSMGAFLLGNTKVFIGNLSFNTHITDLQDFFSGCGEIKSIVIPQRQSGEVEEARTGEYCTRGIAFIEFYTHLPAQSALLKDGRSLNGRIIKVNMSDSPEKSRRPTSIRSNSNKIARVHSSDDPTPKFDSHTYKSRPHLQTLQKFTPMIAQHTSSSSRETSKNKKDKHTSYRHRHKRLRHLSPYSSNHPDHRESMRPRPASSSVSPSN